MPTVLQRWYARCTKCPREVPFKTEGPPYFARWRYLEDGEPLAGWQIPNNDAGNTFTEVRCPDHAIERP